MSEPDPFRVAEWNQLSDVCLFSGCDGDDIDQRGPIWLRDGSMWKACVEHWEAVMRVLGEQATWERTDGARPAAPAKPVEPARTDEGEHRG